MVKQAEPFNMPLPSGWPGRVSSAMLQVTPAASEVEAQHS